MKKFKSKFKRLLLISFIIFILYYFNIDFFNDTLQEVSSGLYESAFDVPEEHANIIKSGAGQLKVQKKAAHHRAEISDMAANFSNALQKRFWDLQNPAGDCDNQKYIVCEFLPCGFGCQMHYLMYCLSEALKQNRIFLLNDSTWRYNQNGFEKYFLPVTEKCKHIPMNDTTMWKGDTDPSVHQKIGIKHMSTRQKKPNYARYFVSEEERQKISKFHTHPFGWWIGQTFKFLLRIQPSFQQELDKTKEELKFYSPVVGLHVRRTDKGTEAEFYPLETYIKQADKFFERYKKEHPNEEFEKNIYVATDDTTVIDEFKANYPGYNFKFNKEAALDAANARETDHSLLGLLKDVLLLVDSDYVVCTLSSNLCRMVYEMMQTKFTDGTSRLFSLDSDYFLDFFSPQFETAIRDHKPMNSKELELKIGDDVHIRFDIPRHIMNTRVRKFLFNGFKNATNLRTNKTGLYPAYKTVE